MDRLIWSQYPFIVPGLNDTSTTPIPSTTLFVHRSVVIETEHNRDVIYNQTVLIYDNRDHATR
jgi:hypothetical protein